jgi:hypothetical protein
MNFDARAEPLAAAGGCVKEQLHEDASPRRHTKTLHQDASPRRFTKTIHKVKTRFYGAWCIKRGDVWTILSPTVVGLKVSKLKRNMGH